MSETSTLNANLFAPLQPSLLDLAKDSAALAAQVAHAAGQADDRNMHNLRDSLSVLAQAFANHSHTLLDLCTAASKGDKTSH